MHRVTLVFILFLLIPDLYIYLVYVVRKTRKAVLHCLYWLPTLLLAAGYVYFMFLTGDNAMSNHTQAIGRLAITIMLFVFPKTIFMLCSLVGVLAHFIVRRCPRSPFTAIGLVLAVVSFFNILYGTFAGITRFDTKEVEYRSADIPEGFDGYRIVQISDIHIGSWQGNPAPIKQLVDSVNGQKPDLIVFTGDLVNQQSHELDGFQEILSQLYAPDGVYSILGNHDYGSYYHWQSPKAEIANLDYLIRQQKAMGWKLLNNEHDILHHKGDSIALIGVENDGEPPFSQFADLPQAMQGTEGIGYFTDACRTYPRHARHLVRTLPCRTYLSGMERNVLRRQKGFVRKYWHRLCGTAVPVRGMAGNYSTKISKRERVTK